MITSVFILGNFYIFLNNTYRQICVRILRVLYIFTYYFIVLVLKKIYNFFTHKRNNFYA